MREVFGMPNRVAGASMNLPNIFCALFQYDTFPVMYKSGLNSVPHFDAHIEVYSPEKIVRVNYDTPYIKGLPVTLTIREKLGDGGFQERTVRKTYEDPYTLEFMELYRCAVEGIAPKTSAEDARQDLELYRMILQANAAQGAFED